MNYERLENAVLDELRKFCNQYVDDTGFENKINEVIKKNNIKVKLLKQINGIELKIKQTTNSIDNLYLDKLNGITTLEQYSRLTLRLKEELENLDIKKQELTLKFDGIDSCDSKNENEKFNRIKEFLSLNNPPRELLANLIDKIFISENKTVEIHYKFRLY